MKRNDITVFVISGWLPYIIMVRSCLLLLWTIVIGHFLYGCQTAGSRLWGSSWVWFMGPGVPVAHCSDNGPAGIGSTARLPSCHWWPCPAGPRSPENWQVSPIPGHAPNYWHTCGLDGVASWAGSAYWPYVWCSWDKVSNVSCLLGK